jgi:hypothetical protein
MTGTMPFTLDYPWDNGAGVALYNSDTGKNNGGTPLRVKSEVWDGGLCTKTDASPVTSPGRVMWAPADS